MKQPRSSWLIAVTAAIPLAAGICPAQPVSSPGTDVLNGICADDAGGSYVAGHTSTPGTAMVAAVVARLDSNGDPLWTRTLDYEFWDELDAVALTSDGGCVAAGATGTDRRGAFDLLIVRYNSSGDLLWTSIPQRGISWENAAAVLVAGQNNVYVAGSIATPDDDDYNMLLLRLTAAGDTVWTRSYGNETDHELALDIAAAENGDIVIAGYSTSYDDDSRDVCLVRVSPAGGLVWQSDLTDPLPSDGEAIIALDGGGFAIAGVTHNQEEEEQSDGMLLRVSDDGVLLWRRSYGGLNDDELHGLALTGNGGFLLAGDSYVDGGPGRQGWVVFTGSAGEYLNSATYGGTGSEQFYRMAQLSSGEIAGVGVTVALGADDGDYLYLSDLDTLIRDIPPSTLPARFAMRTWPNPFNASLRMQVELSEPGLLDLRLYDVLGREAALLAHTQSYAGVHRFTLSSAELGSGLYFLRARVNGSQDRVERVVLVK